MPQKLTQEQFIERCQYIHNNKYNYSKMVYTNALSKVNIICPVHGEFLQIASDHANGRGCRKCATLITKQKTSLSQEEFIRRANIKYHDRGYNYSRAVYKNATSKVEIICPLHGSFFPLAGNFLGGNRIGCPRCANESTKNAQCSNTLEFIDKAIDVHDMRYDYSRVLYTNNTTPVSIICSEHGIFSQMPMTHLQGCGCHECGDIASHENKIKNFAEIYWKTAKQIHNNKYNYDTAIYRGSNENILAICPIHGKFEINARNHLRGTGCLKCSPISKYEDMIQQYLDSNNVEYIAHYRKLKDDIGHIEIDFFIPSKSLGIEVNGLYWHSEESGGKDRKYHLRKTELCERNNIRLIHIFSSEFSDFAKIKNRLDVLFGKNIHKYHARACNVIEIDRKLCGDFLKKYHLQGNDKSKYKYGLFDSNGTLLSVMTFSLPRICLGYDSKSDLMELSRYCVLPGCIINGGASKMLKHFESEHKIARIVTFADRRWSTTSFYETLGFTMDHASPPNYWYFRCGRDTELFHRFGFRKSVLKDKLQIFDPSLTEWENMKNNRYDRVWDCGNYVFEKKLAKNS